MGTVFTLIPSLLPPVLPQQQILYAQAMLMTCLSDTDAEQAFTVLLVPLLKGQTNTFALALSMLLRCQEI